MSLKRVVYGFAALALIFGAALPASAQRPFDPRSYQGKVAGPPTEILVLATPHLSAAPEGWDPGVLEPLLARLVAFDPEVITIETLSGQSFAKLWQYRPVYGDAATSYGSRLMVISAAGSVGTGLGMAEAEAEVRRQLVAWPAAPTPVQRRRLAALLATAGDPYSALVQWWRLDPSERLTKDGITATLMAQLDELGRRRNENNLIGSRLAARLGLDRVHAIDEQDDNVLTPAQMEEFGRSVFPSMASDLRASPRSKTFMDALDRMTTPNDTLLAYRTLNEPATAMAHTDLEWLRIIDRETPSGVGRMRMAAWEVRNLRMAANIREAIGQAPGKRILVIAGSAHKPWLDAYLAMMTDVKIVDAARALDQQP